jgi:acetoacetyl-CoA synthetase
MSDTSAPTSTMVNLLTPIWERVLQRRPIGAEDNFFDLGGDSKSANQLLIEIAELCGRQLSPQTIYQAPTIAALALLLEEPAPHRFPALVQLRAGIDGPPIFLAHGIDGDVTDFIQLVKHIESPRSIYAIQAKGADGVDAPLETVEEMARHYFDAIRQVQPRGPYVLIGYSFGGLVDLEVAREFHKAGEEVALLVMLESYPHAHHLSQRERVRLLFQRIRLHVTTMMKLPIGEAVSYVFRRSERRSHFSGRSEVGETRLSPREISTNPAMQRLRDCNHRAWERYDPQFYGGRIHFVKSEAGSYFPKNPAKIWAHLVGEFEMEIVPGDHIGIVTTQVKPVGVLLSRYLEKMSESK